MSRTFIYARVSTIDQSPENQVQEIKTAGFNIEPHRVITETVSGSMPISRRKGFARLLDKMEKNDLLVVTKLDRLGRNAIDVSTTVAKLEIMGIKVHCLALGGIDLASSAGKMTMGVINIVAQFERDLLIERTQSGLARAKSNGKILGRPQILSESQKIHVVQQLQDGMTIAAIAKHFNISRQTIMRIRNNCNF
ncbi:recombinase family protein [Rickettsia sp. TH2014]|uniref:recombinase family protein n=1 Tax=Rickettsia sp. TH2014 TaxID=1967503 RepID=UPI001C43731F|nr:recombinase family protein [Rickettsia sp. TH2014]